MSKTTKALAILGVVAGLGVSMLPLSSYALPANATGEVKVKTTIDETLTITITGNDDGHSVDTGESASHVVLLSTDATVTGKILNGGNGSGAATVNVTTNNLKGYNVSLKGATAELVGTTNATEKIPAISAAKSDIATSGNSEWGYQVTTSDANFTAAASVVAGSSTGKKILENYQPVTTSGAVIINNGGATQTAGDDFTLTFGVHASESQAADTYSDTITLTAAANNA